MRHIATGYAYSGGIKEGSDISEKEIIDGILEFKRNIDARVNLGRQTAHVEKRKICWL